MSSVASFRSQISSKVGSNNYDLNGRPNLQKMRKAGLGTDNRQPVTAFLEHASFSSQPPEENVSVKSSDRTIIVSMDPSTGEVDMVVNRQAIIDIVEGDSLQRKSLESRVEVTEKGLRTLLADMIANTSSTFSSTTHEVPRSKSRDDDSAADEDQGDDDNDGDKTLSNLDTDAVLKMISENTLTEAQVIEIINGSTLSENTLTEAQVIEIINGSTLSEKDVKSIIERKVPEPLSKEAVATVVAEYTKRAEFAGLVGRIVQEQLEQLESEIISDTLVQTKLNDSEKNVAGKSLDAAAGDFSFESFAKAVEAEDASRKLAVSESFASRLTNSLKQLVEKADFIKVLPTTLTGMYHGDLLVFDSTQKVLTPLDLKDVTKYVSDELRLVIDDQKATIDKLMEQVSTLTEHVLNIRATMVTKPPSQRIATTNAGKVAPTGKVDENSGHAVVEIFNA